MKLNRRKTVLGLGALATGSGAVFSSAAFQSSVAPTSDLRVVVDENLDVKKGDGFDPTSSEYTNNSSFYDGPDTNESSGGAFESDSTALAYVNDKKNENLVIKAAQDVGVSSFTFPNIIQVVNNTVEAVDVGIAYDRGASPSQYGSNVENGTLTYQQAQKTYQFKASELDDGSQPSYAAGSGDLISPDPTGSGVTAGDNNTINDDEDKPKAAATIPAGDSLDIDLVVDTSTHQTAIESEAEGNLSESFGSDSTTVDILDQITVGTFEGL